MNTSNGITPQDLRDKYIKRLAEAENKGESSTEISKRWFRKTIPK